MLMSTLPLPDDIGSLALKAKESKIEGDVELGNG